VKTIRKWLHQAIAMAIHWLVGMLGH